MRSTSILTGILALAAISMPAQAASMSMPIYDVAAYCKGLSDMSGGSAMIYNGCVDMEQVSYDKLKGDWATIPVETVHYCDGLGEMAGGSYSILDGCVRNELSASDAPSTFKY